MPAVTGCQGALLVSGEVEGTMCSGDVRRPCQMHRARRLLLTRGRCWATCPTCTWRWSWMSWTPCARCARQGGQLDFPQDAAMRHVPCWCRLCNALRIQGACAHWGCGDWHCKIRERNTLCKPCASGAGHTSVWLFQTALAVCLQHRSAPVARGLMCGAAAGPASSAQRSCKGKGPCSWYSCSAASSLPPACLAP